MIIHDLKIEENYLTNLIFEDKKSEVRINDRDYQKGDILRFCEYGLNAKVTKHLFVITHIHSGLGLKESYVVLSLHYEGNEKRV